MLNIDLRCFHWVIIGLLVYETKVIKGWGSVKAFSVKSFDGSKIRYWSNGINNKPLLVFIHGWSCKSQYWKFQQAAFLDVFDMVFIDLAAHGKSGFKKGSKRTWDMPSFARDVEAVLNHIGCETWIVIGHSMGGAVGVELAIARPKNTKAVIAVDSLVYEPVYRAAPEAAIAEIMAPFEADFKGAAKAMISTFFLESADPKTVKAICKDVMKSPKETANASLKQIFRWDVDAALAKTETPIVCLNSKAFLTDESEARLSARLTIKPIEEVGHFVMLDAPDTFNAILAETVNELSQPAKHS